MEVSSPLDIERPAALVAYLRRTGRIANDESPVVTTLRGGVSSRTVLVERTNNQNWVIKQSLAKLRVDVDWYSNPARIHREALGIRWLTMLAPPGSIPALVFEDHEQHLLAMEAVPQPHRNWKTMLLAGGVDPNHVRQFGRLLGTIHRRAAERRDAIAGLFGDRSFFESLRIEPYYAYTSQQVPASAPFLSELIAEVRARRLTLVHGDYSPKNILIHDGRLILLDHEVIHFGDPAFDVGFSLAHLLSKAHHLRQWREAFTEASEIYWQAYRESMGDAGWAVDLERCAVRHTLGCLLARVAGRSRLEYLSPAERARQQDVVIALMQKVPSSIGSLAREFARQLG